jgi:predicted alpha/beta-fold hydrolase
MVGYSESDRIVKSAFRPAGWLKNRHAQTIYPSLGIARSPAVTLHSEPLELPDGDIAVVDWLKQAPSEAKQAPILVILHGLEGSAESSYVRHMMQAAWEQNWNAAVLHFRDCGDYRNRLPRRYHAGETNDLRYFLGKLRTEGQEGPIMAVGYSLGGNVLLKYLGEDSVTTPLHAAAAVSVPLNLHICADALNIGFSKLYQYHLLKRMKKAVRRKFNRHTAAFDWERTMRARTFADFDDAVTAPLHGFDGKQEYYDKCSSAGFLEQIERPTLIINALDDPFMLPGVIPSGESLSDYVTIEVSEKGGHVGFVQGGTPWRPTYYLPGRIIEFLEMQLGEGEIEPHALPGL